MENVYEAFFFLKYHGGWSFAEAYNLPVKLRGWFVKRLSRQLEEENAAVKKASSGKNFDGGAKILGEGNAPPDGLANKH